MNNCRVKLQNLRLNQNYCRKLIDIAGYDGGYILAGGAGINKCDPDNLRVIMETVKEYGGYK